MFKIICRCPLANMHQSAIKADTHVHTQEDVKLKCMILFVLEKSSWRHAFGYSCRATAGQ